MSVLFLDLVGFTSLAEAVDAEDVRELLSRYFEAARDCVSRYGGEIEKFIGDAVMAVWGTPIAHEDDAERAVRAALEMVEAVAMLGREAGERPLGARAAVVTGQAAVTLAARGQGMVAGDLVNTAARLQGEAEPGSVLVDEATRRIAGGSISFEPAGSRALRGRAAELEVWRALEPALLAGPLSAGHVGRFIDRESEMDVLARALQATAEDPRCRLISVSGIAGIGKSRLAWELERAAVAMPPTFAWHVGRSPAYGEGIAFAPLAEMVRRRIGVVEGEDAESIQRNLTRVLTDLVSDQAEREWLEPRLLVLLGSSDAIVDEREELFGAWRRFFEAVADRWPSVLVFEDIQWADDGLLDFIEHLAEWSRRHALLVVTMARPELIDRRPTWGAGVRTFTALHLDRLPDEAMAQLLAALAPGLPSEAMRRIRQRADGVPLYAVEMVRMLIDRGQLVAGDGGVQLQEAFDPVEVPDSLHALIASRIDGLPAEDRSLLLAGAVLGRRFHVDALAAVTGIAPDGLRAPLRSLVRREMVAIDDQPRSPGRGQVSFIQELVRDVAYRTLARRERRARHLAAADFLSARDEEELAEPLAEHLLEAHRLGSPDGPESAEIARRARDALRRSARRAVGLHVPERALGLLERALSLTDDEAERADLWQQAAAAARAAARFDVAERYLRDAVTWYSSAGRRTDATRCTAQLASLLLVSHGNPAALTQLERAWKDLDDLQDDPVSAEIAGQLARAHFVAGDFAASLEWCDRALDGAGESGGVTLDALVTRASARAGSGLDGEALGELEQVIAAAEQGGHLMVELRARNNLVVFKMLDDPRASLEGARRVMELARRTGNRDMVLQMVDVGVSAAIDPGEWAWALAAMEEAEEDEVPDVYRVTFAVARTIIRALQGDETQGAALAGGDTIDPTLDPQVLAAVSYARACEALLAGRPAQAAELALSAARQATPIEAWWSTALAIRAALWQGDAVLAGRLLSQLSLPGGPRRAADASVQALTAGLQALNGDRLAAETSYAEASSQLRALDLPLPLGLSLLERHLLLDDPSAGREAAAVFESLGARPLLQRVRAATR